MPPLVCNKANVLYMAHGLGIKCLHLDHDPKAHYRPAPLGLHHISWRDSLRFEKLNALNQELTEIEKNSYQAKVPRSRIWNPKLQRSQDIFLCDKTRLSKNLHHLLMCIRCLQQKKTERRCSDQKICNKRIYTCLREFSF